VTRYPSPHCCAHAKRMKLHPGKRVLLDFFPRSRQNTGDLVTLCGKPEMLSCSSASCNGADEFRATTTRHILPSALQHILTFRKNHRVTLDFLREEMCSVVS
jgi:adenylate kinase